jgi:hypothetical protein
VSELPPPTHTSRDPWPAGVSVPSAAAKLARLATDAGWTVEITYSRGHVKSVRLVDPPYEVATVAVRFRRFLDDARRQARGGWVVYHCRLDRPAKWEAKSLQVWGSDHNPFGGVLGVTDVQDYLREGVNRSGAEVTVWIAQIKQRAADAKERAADAAKARPKKAKVV